LSELDPELKSRLETWFDKAYTDDNLFLTMARRPGLLKATIGFIAYIYGGKSKIGRGLFELCRLRYGGQQRVRPLKHGPQRIGDAQRPQRR